MSFNQVQIDALKAPLSREHVKSRQQAGRSLSYIEGWHAIAEANRIFGFDGWDRELVDLRMVAETQTTIGQSGTPGWRVAYIAKVKVFIHSGAQVTREGIGYGSGIDRDQGSAHESAVKEAETDAMKRALMTFGNQFGLALYDKEQTEVVDSPAPERRRSSPPPATASPVAPEGGENRGTSDADKKIAKAAYDRLRAALREARLPMVVDTIITAGRDELAFVKKINPGAYDQVMALSVARKNELLASA